MVNPELTDQPSTEERILSAARTVFMQKGFHGARMQEIADAAGINKAMLHYYFRSKEKLFEPIFSEAFNQLLPKLANAAEGAGTIQQRITIFVDGYLETVLQFPFIPVFVLSEIHRNPDAFFERYITADLQKSAKQFVVHYRAAAALGLVVDMDPRQLFMHMISLCVFPFAARPMMQKVMQIDDIDFQQMLVARKQLVIEFINKSITPCTS